MALTSSGIIFAINIMLRKGVNVVKVKLLRTDDRLIHGQVMVRWISYLKLKNILIFDDTIAKNPVMASIFKLACPKDVNLIIKTLDEIEDAKTILKGLEDKTIILTKSPLIMEQVLKGGVSSELGYNIGPISSKAGAKKVTPFCHLMDDEIEALKRISKTGIKIFFQQVPNSEILYWDQIENKF